jgi:hypothetical protein
MYVESLDDYEKVHLKDAVIITHENMSIFENRLSSDLFVPIVLLL